MVAYGHTYFGEKTGKLKVLPRDILVALNRKPRNLEEAHVQSTMRSALEKLEYDTNLPNEPTHQNASRVHDNLNTNRTNNFTEGRNHHINYPANGSQSSGLLSHALDLNSPTNNQSSWNQNNGSNIFESNPSTFETNETTGIDQMAGQWGAAAVNSSQSYPNKIGTTDTTGNNQGNFVNCTIAQNNANQELQEALNKEPRDYQEAIDQMLMRSAMESVGMNTNIPNEPTHQNASSAQHICQTHRTNNFAECSNDHINYPANGSQSSGLTYHNLDLNSLTNNQSSLNQNNRSNIFHSNRSTLETGIPQLVRQSGVAVVNIPQSYANTLDATDTTVYQRMLNCQPGTVQNLNGEWFLSLCRACNERQFVPMCQMGHFERPTPNVGPYPLMSHEHFEFHFNENTNVASNKSQNISNQAYPQMNTEQLHQNQQPAIDFSQASLNMGGIVNNNYLSENTFSPQIPVGNPPPFAGTFNGRSNEIYQSAPISTLDGQSDSFNSQLAHPSGSQVDNDQFVQNPISWQTSNEHAQVNNDDLYQDMTTGNIEGSNDQMTSRIHSYLGDNVVNLHNGAHLQNQGLSYSPSSPRVIERYQSGAATDNGSQFEMTVDRSSLGYESDNSQFSAPTPNSGISNMSTHQSNASTHRTSGYYSQDSINDYPLAHNQTTSIGHSGNVSSLPTTASDGTIPMPSNSASSEVRIEEHNIALKCNSSSVDHEPKQHDNVENAQVMDPIGMDVDEMNINETNNPEINGNEENVDDGIDQKEEEDEGENSDGETTEVDDFADDSSVKTVEYDEQDLEDLKQYEVTSEQVEQVEQPQQHSRSPLIERKGPGRPRKDSTPGRELVQPKQQKQDKRIKKKSNPSITKKSSSRNPTLAPSEQQQPAIAKKVGRPRKQSEPVQKLTQTKQQQQEQRASETNRASQTKTLAHSQGQQAEIAKIRGRGRPKKVVPVDLVVKRSRGRPKKVVPVDLVVKRSRGRPKKVVPVDLVVKRSRGRPKKVVPVDLVVKRSRGRPRKNGENPIQRPLNANDGQVGSSGLIMITRSSGKPKQGAIGSNGHGLALSKNKK